MKSTANPAMWVNGAIGAGLMVCHWPLSRVLYAVASLNVASLFTLCYFPVAGAVVGWLRPRGAPGAGLAVVVLALLLGSVSLPFEVGPTAKSLSLGVPCGAGALTAIAEILAASVRDYVTGRAARSSGEDGDPRSR